MHGEQRVFCAWIEPGEQPARSLGPSIEDGLFTAYRSLARQSTSDARGTTCLIRIPILAIGSFAGLRGSLDVIEQPANSRQLLEGLGGFALGEHRL
jgi:hypothetical protein